MLKTARIKGLIQAGLVPEQHPLHAFLFEDAHLAHQHVVVFLVVEVGGDQLQHLELVVREDVQIHQAGTLVAIEGFVLDEEDRHPHPVVLEGGVLYLLDELLELVVRYGLLFAAGMRRLLQRGRRRGGGVVGRMFLGVDGFLIGTKHGHASVGKSDFNHLLSVVERHILAIDPVFTVPIEAARGGFSHQRGDFFRPHAFLYLHGGIAFLSKGGDGRTTADER